MKLILILSILPVFITPVETIAQDSAERSLEEITGNSFSRTDVKSLRKILTFFDGFVRAQTGISQIDSAYRCYMKDLKESETTVDFNNKLFTNAEKTDSFLIRFRSDPLFHAIWRTFYNIDPLTKDTTSFELYPNLSGIYGQLLNKAVEIDPVFREYKNSVETAGTLTAEVISGFQNIYDKIDLKNELLRLIVALHYITVIS